METEEIINKIDDVIASDDYKNFPATVGRLVQIRAKILKGDELSSSDLKTLEYNKIETK